MSNYYPREEWLAFYEHPKWQKKRLEILEYAEWQCQGCGSKDTQLQVHHARYIKGKKPWEYRNGWLTAMCRQCHRKLHGIEGKSPAAASVAPALPEGEKPAVKFTPEALKPTWLGVVAYTMLNRPLIGMWVQDGWLVAIEGDLMRVHFEERNSFSAEFLNDGHSAFLNEAASQICQRQMRVELSLVNALPTPTNTAKFGQIFDLLAQKI